MKKPTSKPWYKSRGIWLGIITSLIGSLDIAVEMLQADTLSMEGLALASIGVLKIWERFTRSNSIIN